ncbi:histone-lysine N-methyltransferase, H3 lysine-9 specific SUVH5-like [Chenopodium quinoa]|uniref:histone-lysine N-methyltransferase, H3 lysine-9 specific SUVH5-like n=1 Tax=Chenopodium quinoa TaxID=63459 RepID=UPI000B77B687|nr:histone-lysine N-methyltransferase, H3 lysine-9 specific SUVH5-like [Chenopodium quinoa]
MESSESKFNNNVASGSGTSTHNTKFIQYVTGFPPGFDSNLVGSNQGEQPRTKWLDERCRYHWWRKVGAVKSKPGKRGECDRIKVKKSSINVDDSNEERARVEVEDMLKLFRKKFEEISENRNNVGDKKGRIDLMAMNELINEGKIIKVCSSRIGHVPGVVVGDKFQYRVELVLVGLHRHFERGIDTMDWGGTKIATCVVANEGLLDNMNDPNVLTYIGEGGNSKAKELEKRPSDQELKCGNLALWESKKTNNPVRVVKGFKVNRMCRGRVVQRTEYVYDGLYEVQSCEKKQGLQRNCIFEFKLIRCTGQPAVSYGSCKRKMRFEPN